MPKLFQGLRNTMPVDRYVEKIIFKEDKALSPAYLVKMACYYDCEVPALIHNELILIDEDDYWEWVNDWYEGQANVIIYAVYGVDEIDLQDNIQ